MSFDPIQYPLSGSSTYATPIFSANGKPVLIGNLSNVNNIYLGPTRGSTPSLQEVAVIPPLGFLVLDGEEDIYAICLPGQTATVQVLPGASYWDPGLITATKVIVEGPNAGIFFYNGTPSLGNPPVLSVTTATVDPYGNTVNQNAISSGGFPYLLYAGTPTNGNLIVAMSPTNIYTDLFSTAVPGPGLSLSANQVTPSPFNNWTTLFCSNGINTLRFVAGVDSNIYDTGRLSLRSANSIQSITSTTPATITGLSAQVFPGRYKLHAVIVGQQGGAAFGVGFQVAGPTVSIVQGRTLFVNDTGSNTGGANVGQQTHGSFPTNIIGPSYAALNKFTVTIDLDFTVTAQNLVSIQAFQGTATHQFTIVASGGTMDLEPCS